MTQMKVKPSAKKWKRCFSEILYSWPHLTTLTYYWTTGQKNLSDNVVIKLQGGGGIFTFDTCKNFSLNFISLALNRFFCHDCPWLMFRTALFCFFHGCHRTENRRNVFCTGVVYLLSTNSQGEDTLNVFPEQWKFFVFDSEEKGKANMPALSFSVVLIYNLSNDGSKGS